MQRVVILFPGALGDALLALPAWRALRRRHGGAHLTLVVNGALVSLIAACGVADAIERLDGLAVAGLCAGGSSPAWLEGRPTVYTWFGAADAALRERIRALASTCVLARVERADGPLHAAAAYAGHIGERSSPDQLAADSRVVVGAGSLLPPDLREKPLLAVHAGAGARAKCWPRDAVQIVVDGWRRAGGAVVEIRGPAEGGADRLDTDVVREGRPLLEVAADIAAADAFLGNDSGISHLAGAVGARGVVVFGPTDPGRWRPLGGELIPVVAPHRVAFPAARLDPGHVTAVLARFLPRRESPPPAPVPDR